MYDKTLFLLSKNKITLFNLLLSTIRDNLIIKCKKNSTQNINITMYPISFKSLSYYDRRELTQSIHNAIKKCSKMGYDISTVNIFIKWCNDLLEYYGWEDYDHSFIICLDDRFCADNIKFTKEMIYLLDYIIET